MKKFTPTPKHHYQKEKVQCSDAQDKSPKANDRTLVSGFISKIWLVLVFLPLTALAQTPEQAANTAINQLDFTKGSGAAAGDLTDLLNSLLNRIPYFLGGLALLALLYSGFIYVTAFGDATKMETAKKNITWTVIGIIAVAAIYAIIRIVVAITAATPLTAPAL